MGYTHSFQINRDLTHEEFEDISCDVRAIIDVAVPSGIGITGDARGLPSDPVLDSELICLNGMADESGEPLMIWRQVGREAPYDAFLNFCKTYRRNYSPVVEAALIALKQRVPHEVMVGSDGAWGYEWLHGSACVNRKRKPHDSECLNVDERHVQMSGRGLYRLAFREGPEPVNVFQSPLVGTELEGQTIYMPRDLPCKRRGTGYEGVPFGVTLDTFINQGGERPGVACMICGEDSATWIDTAEDKSWARRFDGPMCSFCFRERLLSGALLGYRFADSILPYRLRPAGESETQMILQME